jgi:hypothetical protein
MDKIKWCINKKDGLSLVDPNSNLAIAYLNKAEDALKSMRVNIIKDWKISTAYYTIYYKLGLIPRCFATVIQFVMNREPSRKVA